MLNSTILSANAVEVSTATIGKFYELFRKGKSVWNFKLAYNEPEYADLQKSIGVEGVVDSNCNVQGEAYGVYLHDRESKVTVVAATQELLERAVYDAAAKLTDRNNNSVLKKDGDVTTWRGFRFDNFAYGEVKLTVSKVVRYEFAAGILAHPKDTNPTVTNPGVVGDVIVRCDNRRYDGCHLDVVTADDGSQYAVLELCPNFARLSDDADFKAWVDGAVAYLTSQGYNVVA